MSGTRFDSEASVFVARGLLRAPARGRHATVWRLGAIATVLVGIAALLQSCNPRAAAAMDDPPLEIRIEIRDASGKTRRAFDSAEAITFELTVRNTGNESESVTFPTAQTHDFVVTSPRGSEIWRASQGRFFSQMLTALTFAPGETRRFTSSWNQESADGTAAIAGEYRAVGFLAAASAGMASSPVIFTIR